MGAPYREPARMLPEPPRRGGTLFISLVPSFILIAVGLGARVTLRDEEGSGWEVGLMVAFVTVIYVAVIRMDLQRRGARR